MANLSDCIIWAKGKSEGYGVRGTRSGKRDGKKVYVHRIKCAEVNGPPPPDKPMALHRCGNRACYNGEHLYWGTKRDNTEDSREHGTIAAGERHGGAKLTVGEVRLIRAIKLSSYKLAPMIGIAASTIRSVRNPKGNWKCLIHL